jgi:NAD(P)H-dependent FMN reductase
MTFSGSGHGAGGAWLYFGGSHLPYTARTSGAAPFPGHNTMPLLEIIVVSTRPSRKGPAVAAWFEQQARSHGAFEVELVDLAAVNLPMFDEPEHPRLRKYQHAHTRAWSDTVARADAFALVTPEYNFSMPPALVNAIDYLVHEWAYKPVGFVSYGGVSGGLRAVQMIKQLVTSLKMMPIPEAVTLPMFTKHLDAETGGFDPGELQAKAAAAMLTELRRWTDALAALRAPAG